MILLFLIFIAYSCTALIRFNSPDYCKVQTHTKSRLWSEVVSFPVLEVFSLAWERLGFPGLNCQTREWVMNTECAWDQPWPHIPLLPVNHLFIEDSNSHRSSLPFLPSTHIIASSPLRSLFQLSHISFKILQESHICFLSHSWLLAHHTPTHICAWVCACSRWVSSWMTVIGIVVPSPRDRLIPRSEEQLHLTDTCL